MENITISREYDTMDIDFIYSYLTRSYWAKGRSREDVVRSMKNSFCFAVFNGKQQVGFARLVTDQVVFAWLMDVFIIDGFQGLGIGKKLIAYILNIPELSNVNGIGLRTNDAHGLYERFGFEKIDKVHTWMLRKNNIQN